MANETHDPGHTSVRNLKRSVYPGIFILLAALLAGGCTVGKQPAQLAFAPSITTGVFATEFATLTVSSATATPVPIRLPFIANGSNLTPTPFQPVAGFGQVPSSPTLQPEAAPASISIDPRVSSPAVTAIPPPMPLLGDQATAGDGPINILLIGSDQRSGKFFRTDTLIIASVRPSHQVVTLISIPRDLFVFIPGWTMQRINSAYLHGEMTKYPGRGTGLLKDTILYNLGVRIDHIAIVNFEGFKTIVDTLGGIDLPLYCPYTDWRVINPVGNLENPNNWRLHTEGPGLVHMDGDLALWYARSRLRSNDYDRGRRQQEVLRGIYTQAMKLNVIPRLPALYQQVGDVIQTDMRLEDVLTLAPLALKLDAPRIRSFYINNRLVKAWWTPEGANVLLPKIDKIQSLIQEAMSPPDAGEEDRLTTWIEIANHTANPYWEVLAAERLHYAGFETRLVSPDSSEPAKKTWLIDLKGGAGTEKGKTILSLLGLPEERLLVEDTQPGGAEFRLMLGADYDPCFNPSKINK
jgi:LCP family protein required for cell wall assembly